MLLLSSSFEMHFLSNSADARPTKKKREERNDVVPMPQDFLAKHAA